ncbi:hypothetical protein CK203_052378 [Vitis vinifera]|uniref:Uncharacterized protein n=1 Tax=Vitis vinifera TaxID=29760 RepID=A0A438H3R7_VITVI|nr:hypothetical protein CK203_052378 [Vitis vinifera]
MSEGSRTTSPEDLTTGKTIGNVEEREGLYYLILQD